MAADEFGGGNCSQNIDVRIINYCNFLMFAKCTRTHAAEKETDQHDTIKLITFSLVEDIYITNEKSAL